MVQEREKARMQQYGRQFYRYILDEKWFYTTSQRRKVTYLPPSPSGIPEEVTPAISTTVSSRDIIKMMFLVAVAKPIK